MDHSQTFGAEAKAPEHERRKRAKPLNHAQHTNGVQQPAQRHARQAGPRSRPSAPGGSSALAAGLAARVGGSPPGGCSDMMMAADAAELEAVYGMVSLQDAARDLRQRRTGRQQQHPGRSGGPAPGGSACTPDGSQATKSLHGLAAASSARGGGGGEARGGGGGELSESDAASDSGPGSGCGGSARAAAAVAAAERRAAGRLTGAVAGGPPPGQRYAPAVVTPRLLPGPYPMPYAYPGYTYPGMVGMTPPMAPHPGAGGAPAGMPPPYMPPWGFCPMPWMYGGMASMHMGGPPPPAPGIPIMAVVPGIPVAPPPPTSGALGSRPARPGLAPNAQPLAAAAATAAPAGGAAAAPAGGAAATLEQRSNPTPP